MYAVTWVAVVLIFAQDPSATAEELRVQRFVLSDGTVLYGTIVRETSNQVTIQPDRPWLPQGLAAIPLLRKDIEEQTTELGVKRKQRWAEEARADGFANLGTDDAPHWVRIAEIEFADRARAMAAQIEPAKSQPEPGGGGASGDAAQAPGEDAPDFVRLWGPHVLIGLVGLVLCGAALKFLVLRD